MLCDLLFQFRWVDVVLLVYCRFVCFACLLRVAVVRCCVSWIKFLFLLLESKKCTETNFEYTKNVFKFEKNRIPLFTGINLSKIFRNKFSTLIGFNMIWAKNMLLFVSRDEVESNQVKLETSGEFYKHLHS